MSRYIVRIVGPSGMERYLWHGQSMSCQENAQKFVRAGSAWNAAKRYLAIYKNMTADVIDVSDPERQV